MDAFMQAHPALESPTIADLARVAVEFTYQSWNRDHEDLFPRPPSGVYWTVRLGRLALTRDGTFDWHHRISSRATDRDRAQRFESFDEAVKVVTKVFGREPEHAIYMRTIAVQFVDKPALAQDG